MKLRSIEVTGRPIVRWPGTFTSDRRSAPFKAGWSSTIDILDRELFCLQAKNAVLQLAMRESDFRRDGAPKASARADHPGVILSLDSHYGPLSYPCDRFLTWQDNLRAIALALEALRKVDRYGVTKHGEQYTGWKQLDGRPTPQPMTVGQAAAFLAEATGDPEANGGDMLWEPGRAHGPSVDRAYRIAVKRLHPDTPGGSTEEFQRLQEARRVLDGAR